MPYLISLFTIVAAVLVLLVLLVRLSGPVRRLTGTAQLCAGYLGNRMGMLKARIAGLKLELHRRHQARQVDHSRRSPAA